MSFTRDDMDQAREQITNMLDGLPIIAAQIGIRTAEHSAGESTSEELAFAQALYKVSDTWQKEKP